MLTQQICSNCFPAPFGLGVFSQMEALNWLPGPLQQHHGSFADSTLHFERVLSTLLPAECHSIQGTNLFILQTKALGSKTCLPSLPRIGSEVKKAVQTCQGSPYMSVMIQHYRLGADAADVPSWWSWKPFWPCCLGHSELFPGVFWTLLPHDWGRSYLLSLYHPQVQRGFRSVLVYLTALDTSSDFLAVGSSIGMLYLYCRRLAHMNKYSLEVRALVYCIVCFYCPLRFARRCCQNIKKAKNLLRLKGKYTNILENSPSWLYRDSFVCVETNSTENYLPPVWHPVSTRVCFQGRSDAITAVKLLSCFDDLVAVGTASGRVAVFQLVSPLPGRNKQVRKLLDMWGGTKFAGPRSHFFPLLPVWVCSCDVLTWLASTRVPSRLWRGAPMGWNCSLETIRDVWFSHRWTWTRWDHWTNECLLIG